MSRLIWHGSAALRKVSKASAAVVYCAADKIAEKARRIVPVKTGKLKHSISAPGSNIVVSEPYARAVEFGTATRAAQPFLRPAIKQFDEADLKQCIK